MRIECCIPEYRECLLQYMKSTTLVNATDLSKADEYVLTHQETDAEGNLCSNIYKVRYARGTFD